MTYTLTTPLYYVNDRPHLGSVYTTLICDALARYRRLKGEEVIFISGCDEHGQKILRTAEAAGESPQAYTDRISGCFRSVWQHWNIGLDRFIRTTDPRHRQVVQEFFRRVERSGDVVEGRQQGWYCVACEEFKDVAHAAEDPQCPIHHRSLEWRDEQNLFFRLSRYQSAIEELIRRPGFIAPAARRHEVENFVAQGLRDFSISRIHLPWGIPVPGHDGHTFYVWFDALLGYITALLEPDDPADLDLACSRGWPASLHVIGKDILRFHAVYWPAMLLSAGLEPPASVFGHGFLTREGRKMGKTLGNVLDPDRLLEACGSDAVRWGLLRDVALGDDGDFQQQRFTDLINNDLANTIGNLLNRSVSMARKWFEASVPPTGEALAASHPLARAAARCREQTLAAYDRPDFKAAAEAIVELAVEANGFLNERAPWKRIKQEQERDRVGEDLYAVLEATRVAGLLMNPIVPELSARILTQLGEAEAGHGTWLDQLDWGRLPAARPLPEPVPVMQRLELDSPL
ncbi:methionine--tRNA ligase [Synechococcus sp. RSCCF101]|uniref:methionine--tRNA ligase n=1 Tax=Synechococcus sp. RSCCF101 TaxID=2511069 RepID=UPI001246D31B|nr:methionine--tRNA ligase [Synechococcus sp. RSCCF101]QEY31745.1 methionine--tRNA ligase [Synechococcus sp. RSCCF101]